MDSATATSEFIRSMDSMRQGLLQGAAAASAGQVSNQLKEEATSRQRLLTLQIFASNQMKATLHANPNHYSLMHTVSLGYQPTGPVELVPKNLVTIKDLMDHIGEAWLGKYFVCRTIVWPMKQNAVQLVVEDTTEDKCIVVSLYNWVLDEVFDPYSLPIGTTLIIKNPWLKVAGSGTLAIRVDNPAEVEIDNGYKGWRPLNLTMNRLLGEETPEPCKDYKEQGNSHFRQGKFHSAIRSFSNGIIKDPTNVILFYNRSMCYLKTGRPIEALKDAEKALELEPGNCKAIWRKCVALSRLNKHQEALETLKINATAVASNSDLQNLQESWQYMYENRNYGKYNDFEAKVEPAPIGNHLNYVEFKGPVKVVPIAGKGRGMVVTQAVKSGDILIVSRAFDIITLDSNGHETVVNANYGTSTVNTPTTQKLITSIAHRIRDHPELRAELYQLYAGPKYEALDPNSNDQPDSPLLVDMERIEKILHFNAFGEGDFQTLVKDNKDRKAWSGLWILPSFINHSCTDTNSVVAINGDFMLIIAQKDMDSGTELIISYFECKNIRYKERKKHLDRYGFACICKLCKRKR